MNVFKPEEHLTRLPRRQRLPSGEFKTVYSDYLEVKWRLVWLRQECPEASIQTRLIEHDAENGRATFTAEIQGRAPGSDKSCSVTATGTETRGDFGDYVEKAETKAIGRALALLGYGTQFAGEDVDEGAENPVDSPVARDADTGRPVNTPRPAASTPFAMPAGTQVRKGMVRAGAPRPTSVVSTVVADTAAAAGQPAPEAVKTQIRNLFEQRGFKGYSAEKYIADHFGGKQAGALTMEELLKLRDLLDDKGKPARS